MFNSLRSKALFSGLIITSVISGATVAFAQVAALDNDPGTITTKSAAIQENTTRLLPPAPASTNAANVSAGVFGQNTGNSNGDYSFPMRLSIGYLGFIPGTSYGLVLSSGNLLMRGSASNQIIFSLNGTDTAHIEGGSTTGITVASDSERPVVLRSEKHIFGVNQGTSYNQFEAASTPTSVINIFGSFGQKGYTGFNYDGTAGLKLTASNYFHNTNTWSMQTTRGFDGGTPDRLAFKYANNDIVTMSGNEVLTLTRGGYLGIGNTSPSYKLDVTGSIHSASGGFVFPDGTVQTTAATPRGIGTTTDAKMATSQGEPTMSCDDDTVGLMSLDIADNRLYVCSGAKLGWQYSALTK